MTAVALPASLVSVAPAPMADLKAPEHVQNAAWSTSVSSALEAPRCWASCNVIAPDAQMLGGAHAPWPPTLEKLVRVQCVCLALRACRGPLLTLSRQPQILISIRMADVEHPESDSHSDFDCDAKVTARRRLAPQACGNAGPLLPGAMSRHNSHDRRAPMTPMMLEESLE